MQVLIVDDDDIVRTTLADLIRGWGYEAWGVPHGRAAIEYLDDLENPRPNLIILDGRMPVMNGEEFLLYREQHESLRSIPVVVFSATASEIPCSSAQGYVAKPFVGQVRPYVEKFCSI
jgi:CheY-like chemotaxis protein